MTKKLNFVSAILDFGDHLGFSYWLHTFFLLSVWHEDNVCQFSCCYNTVKGFNSTPTNWTFVNFADLKELFAHFHNHLSTNFDHIWWTDVKLTSGYFFFFVWYSIFNIVRDIQKKLIFFTIFRHFFKGPNSLIYF